MQDCADEDSCLASGGIQKCRLPPVHATKSTQAHSLLCLLLQRSTLVTVGWLWQLELKEFEEADDDDDGDDDDASDDDHSPARSQNTKSLASFEDVGSDVGSEDTRSQVSLGSYKDARSAVSFGATHSRRI